MMPKFYDVTLPITQRTVVYPGDPSFRYDTLSSVVRGDPFDLKEMHMGNHMGTHVDFPAHVKPGGATSSNYGLDRFIGPGLVLDIPAHQRAIQIDMLQGRGITKNDIVMFKTTNSGLWQRGKYTEDFVYLDPEAAHYLREQGVSMVGIDYISIDGCHATDLPSHHILLGGGVLILEGLDLSPINVGRYTVFCLPLNIPDMDGLPARVVLQG